MPFQERHEQIVKKAGEIKALNYWLKTMLFGFIVFVVVSIYHYIQYGLYDIYDVNTSYALTGMILIGLSFALSGITFFWDFADTKLLYRKYLGLVGYFFILAHVLFSLYGYFFLKPVIIPTFDISFGWRIGGFVISNLVAFAAGLTAFLIFSMMAAISNKYATQELGGQRWRMLLRTGYIAYIVIVIHFGLKRFVLWKRWLSGDFGTLPPLSLIIFVFVIGVLGMRIALYFGIKHKLQQRKLLAQQKAIEAKQLVTKDGEATNQNSKPEAVVTDQ